MKFEDTLQKYYGQVQTSPELLGEAVLSDFFRGLRKGTGGQNNAQFTYRLENPKKNLPILATRLGLDSTIDKTKPLAVGTTVTGAGRFSGSFQIIATDATGQNLKIQPLSNAGKLYGTISDVTRHDIVESLSLVNEATGLPPTQPFDLNGNIHPDAFKISFYNAFAASSDGLVRLDDLLRGRVGGKDYSRHIGREVVTTPLDKANKSVLDFIKDNDLNDIIKGFDSYEKAQAGSKATKFGTAINKGIGNIVKSTAADIGKMVTTQGVNYI